MIVGLPLAHAFERRRELIGFAHGFDMASIGAGKCHEIRVPEVGCLDAAGILTLLVHADGVIDAVVDDDQDNRKDVLYGGGELLAVHQEAAVAGESDIFHSGNSPLAAIAAGVPSSIELEARASCLARRHKQWKR